MCLQYRYFLQIAGISLLLSSDQQLPDEQNFKPFQIEGVTPDWQIFFRETDKLPFIPDEVVHEDTCYRVHLDGKGGYVRSFFDPPRDFSPYAIATSDMVNKIITVDYLQKGAHCVSEMHNSFFHLGFEKVLIEQDRLCLHASCVKTPLGGILFSGPSGIGKSTQADLWCSYRNAQQINGDRPILSKDQGKWLAWGSPYAGSSQCHINEFCEISAIVMLRQAPECSLRRMQKAEAFRCIWSGLTMYSWDGKFVAAACDLALDLVGTVAVYEFGCTPDQQAVDFLESELRKELYL